MKPVNKKVLSIAGLLGLGVIAVACGGAAGSSASLPDEVVTEETDAILSSGEESVAVELELPQPQNELAEGGYRWSQLLARDAIFPIYDPQFAAADEAPYVDEELVIGVEINGEAKAYAIGPLNSREMVNDTLGGVPILVTW